MGQEFESLQARHFLVVKLCYVHCSYSVHNIILLQENGAPEEIRTPDPLLRRQLLYPAELQALGRGSKIRTYDHSLPKRVRYQTAPYPEDCDINDNKRNNQSSLHIKFMMRKYY